MIGSAGDLEGARANLANSGPIANAVLYNNGKALWDGIVKSGALVQANATVTSQPVGAIVPFAGATAPAGWLLCGGQAVSRTTYADLFAVVGTTYGAGDGSTTFNLPDLRGRVLAGKDNMGGTAANRLTSGGSGVTGTALGAAGGSQFIASHTHTTGFGQTSLGETAGMYHRTGNSTFASGDTGGAGGAGSNIKTVSSASGNPSITSSSGTGNVQPTIVTNYIIKALADPVNTIGVALAGSAGGDLAGSYPNPTITNITNAPIHNSNTALSFRTSGTERMSVDATGRVTKPYQPMFFAYGNNWNARGASDQSAVPFNLTLYNVGGHYNTSNGRFTAPVAGYYLFTANLRLDGTGGGGYLRYGIKKNNIGSGWDTGNGHAHAIQGNNHPTDYNTLPISHIIYLAANDYVWAWCFHVSTGGNVLMGESNFAGYLLG